MTDKVPKSDLDIWGREDIKKHCPAGDGVNRLQEGSERHRPVWLSGTSLSNFLLRL